MTLYNWKHKCWNLLKTRSLPYIPRYNPPNQEVNSYTILLPNSQNRLHPNANLSKQYLFSPFWSSTPAAFRCHVPRASVFFSQEQLLILSCLWRPWQSSSPQTIHPVGWLSTWVCTLLPYNQTHAVHLKQDYHLMTLCHPVLTGHVNLVTWSCWHLPTWCCVTTNILFPHCFGMDWRLLPAPATTVIAAKWWISNLIIPSIFTS